MILVSAVDYFRKYRKIWKMSFLKKIIKKSFISKISGILCFSSRLDGFEITCTVLQFEKNALKNLIFFKNLIFAFLKPKIVNW